MAGHCRGWQPQGRLTKAVADDFLGLGKSHVLNMQKILNICSLTWCTKRHWGLSEPSTGEEPFNL